MFDKLQTNYRSKANCFLELMNNLYKKLFPIKLVSILLLVIFSLGCSIIHTLRRGVANEEHPENAKQWQLGDPKNGIEDLKSIYRYINIYRSRHDGQYPSSDTEVFLTALSLLSERKIPFAEGFEKATLELANPDSRFADSPILRRAPNEVMPYYVTNKRPNGDLIGSPKTIGTRDVLSYTGIYYHPNGQRTPNGMSPNPNGFYLVLWDDGQVTLIPYDEILYVSQDSKTLTITFPGQAGVPDRIMSYQEYWKNLANLSPPLGKPIPKGQVEPIPDNSGPESLVTLSRLFNYPNHYGIEREKLWQTFSPAQPEFTLPEVQTGAQKLGLPLELRKLSLEELEQLNTPALFLTSDDKRIVTLANLDDKEAIVIDRGLTRVVSREILAQKYGGEVLLPQAADAASSIAAQDPVRVLTLANKDEEVKQQVTITNRGTQPLTLQIERPIPGVTNAELSSDTVAPGASATLSLSIKWRDILKGESQNVFVFLKTNDAIRPRLQLGFKLQLKGGATTP
jgi:hypothetical protein